MATSRKKSPESDVARGRALLLVSSVRDVAPPDHPTSVDFADAGPAHRKLYRDYLAALRAAVDEANDWWDGRITLAMKRNRRSRERTERDQLAKVPVGPAMSELVIGAFRTSWLRCAELNEKEGLAQRIAPEQLTLGWMIDTEPKLIAVLGRWTYLPVGLDADGRWV